jgi:hypothetical protein
MCVSWCHSAQESIARVQSQSNEPKSMSSDHQNSIKIVILLDLFCGATLMPC